MTGQLQLGDTAPPFDKTRSQWHTSPEACRRLAGWLPVDAKLILEPSAGGGNIIQAVFDEWEGRGGITIGAVEIDPAWCAVLRKRFDGKSVEILEDDFLVATAPPDAYCAAIANPPLDGGMGPVHVERMLRFTPRVISVLTAGDMHNKGARSLLWKRFRLTRLAHLGRWKVGGSSLRDFVAVEVRREPPGGLCEVEWWGVE